MTEPSISRCTVALFANTVDYAGTFPPAALSLPAALKVAATFRRNAQHPWLLAKIALKLEHLVGITSDALYAAGADGSLWEFSALANVEEKPATYVQNLQQDLTTVKYFNLVGYSATCRRLITSLETKLPSVLVEHYEELAVKNFGLKFLEIFGREMGIVKVHPYIEIPMVGEWRHAAEVLGATLSKKLNLNIGLKFRTGGSSLPSAEDLAFAIRVSNKFSLRFKATQGLHHAITRDGGFGFANLFAALSSAKIYPDTFGAEAIARCLADQDSKNFKITATDFTWDKFHATVAQIEEARATHAGCFGSCSLDEPDKFLATELGEGNKN